MIKYWVLVTPYLHTSRVCLGLNFRAGAYLTTRYQTLLPAFNVAFDFRHNVRMFVR